MITFGNYLPNLAHFLFNMHIFRPPSCQNWKRYNCNSVPPYNDTVKCVKTAISDNIYA